MVFPRVFEMLAESDEFDVLVSNIDHSNWLVGTERELARNIADDLRRACDGTDIFPCVITVTTACPPADDLRWAREHDVPLLKGTLPGLRALASRLRHRRRVPPGRDVAAAQPIEGAGALPELDSARIAEGYGVPYVRAERCADPEQAAAAAEPDRLSGGRQGRQRGPQGAGRRRRPEPGRRLPGAGGGREMGGR